MAQMRHRCALFDALSIFVECSATSTRASLAWVSVNHDERKVLKYLEKFYRVARLEEYLRQCYRSIQRELKGQ